MVDDVTMFPELIFDLLSCGHSVRFRAPGRSMYPTIREGEVITVRPVSPSAVKKGDIILYRLEKSVIAHRVARVERTEGNPLCFLFRDDTWGYRDAPVEAQQILGKVVSVERGGRTLSLYTTRVKMRRMAHVFASRLKRLVRRAFL